MLQLIACLLVAVGTPELTKFESVERHMGVDFEIVVYAANEQSARAGFKAAFARIEKLNQAMSDYEPQSELSQLSRSAPTESPVEVSDDLWEVLRQSQEMSRKSGGAFDVTVGPLTRLWRRARRQKKLPTDRRLAEALESVGFQFIQLDPKKRTVALSESAMRLDLGGIAKGYAADQALLKLRERGLNRALVNASGDIAIGEAPPDKPGWKIGIAPLEAESPPSRFLHLNNCAIATSGDAWQSVEIDGRRYSHIVDPRTGLGLSDRSSVTVIAPNCTTADALASAVSVLGPAAGIQFVEKHHDASALIVQASDGQVETRQSTLFPSADE